MIGSQRTVSRPLESELRRCGFLAAFGISLLLTHDPGVGLVEQLGHSEQVVEAEAVGFFPGIILLVAAAGNDAVPGAFVALVLPDCDLENSDADFVCWF